MEFEQLKLGNQLCFPVYAASRLITREYQPYLDKLGITYPQYLVLMVLWETDGISVNEISQKLILNTNTVTPLLKRMESMGILRRQRSQSDERKVIVELTDKGRQLRNEAAEIPAKLASGLISGSMNIDELMELKAKLYHVINFLNEKISKEEGEGRVKGQV
jgi:MarR family transcriptional regulator, organic hydroperoxide resistance regulator